jgi:hypothetical protein
MKDVTLVPTERISEDQHKLALRLLRELQNTRETGEVTIQEGRATERTQVIHPHSDEPGTLTRTTKVGTPAQRQALFNPSRPAIPGSPVPKRRKFRLFPFLFAKSRELPARQLPSPPAAELPPATKQEPSSQVKPSRPYILIPIPVRTNAPNTEEVLKLFPRSYKHVYLLIDGKRSIAEITFMKRQLGEEGIVYIVKQLEKAGIVKVAHRVELRTEK